jgi:arylsulfatase A-like enzyme
MATLGTMMQAAGYYTAYQGKWHLSNAYRTPANPGSTATALVPYGFSEFNDWGDIDGGAWAKGGPGHCRASGAQYSGGTSRRWHPSA